MARARTLSCASYPELPTYARASFGPVHERQRLARLCANGPIYVSTLRRAWAAQVFGYRLAYDINALAWLLVPLHP